MRGRSEDERGVGIDVRKGEGRCGGEEWFGGRKEAGWVDADGGE